MRKIDEKIAQAIIDKKAINTSNTTIITEDKYIKVYLHGNQIAWIGNYYVRLSDCDWATRTTVTRLNTILYALGLPIKAIIRKGITRFMLGDVCIGLNELKLNRRYYL